jgi:hypothetical protein
VGCGCAYKEKGSRNFRNYSVSSLGTWPWIHLKLTSAESISFWIRWTEFTLSGLFLELQIHWFILYLVSSSAKYNKSSTLYWLILMVKWTKLIIYKMHKKLSAI